MVTKFLDLDALASDVEFTISLNGKKHIMVEPTVGKFITQMKEIEDMPLNQTPRQELETSITLIQRVFPTVKKSELEDLTLSQVKELAKFTLQASGQDVEKIEGEGEGNASAGS